MISTVALVIALVGTPLGNTATRPVREALFARDAGAIGGIKAAKTPQAGRLLPLGSNRQFPETVVPLDSTTKAPNFAVRVWSDRNQPVLNVPGLAFPNAIVQFDQVAFDTAGQFDLTHPDQLVPRITGVYVISASVQWQTLPDGNLLGDRVLRVDVNGRKVGVSQSYAAGPSQSVTVIYKLKPGDVVQAEVGASSETSLVSDGQDLPDLSMVWVAPG